MVSGPIPTPACSCCSCRSLPKTWISWSGSSSVGPAQGETFGDGDVESSGHVADAGQAGRPVVGGLVALDLLFGDAERIGELIAKGKSVAPTHPHPDAPDTPPAVAIAGPPAGLLDRVREGITRD